jgi:hypothetical protein
MCWQDRQFFSDFFFFVPDIPDHLSRSLLLYFLCELVSPIQYQYFLPSNSVSRYNYPITINTGTSNTNASLIMMCDLPRALSASPYRWSRDKFFFALGDIIHVSLGGM